MAICTLRALLAACPPLSAAFVRVCCVATLLRIAYAGGGRVGAAAALLARAAGERGVRSCHYRRTGRAVMRYRAIIMACCGRAAGLGLASRSVDGGKKKKISIFYNAGGRGHRRGAI